MTQSSLLKDEDFSANKLKVYLITFKNNLLFWIEMIKHSNQLIEY